MTIESRLEALEATLSAVQAQLATLTTRRASAPAVDLDHPKADPEVRFNPKRWDGESCIGLRLSQCSPDFLVVWAEAKEYFASNPKPGKEQFAAFDRLDGARARAWAERIRSGTPARHAAPPPADDYATYETNDAFPF